MLTNSLARAKARLQQKYQSGVVLIIALIVLVALTLAAVSLVRSVDTGNIIAGNLAFQQAATHSADAGVETAVAWLQDCGITHSSCTNGTLDNDSPGNGYVAGGSAKGQNPVPGQSWDDFWTSTIAPSGRVVSLPSDAAGNTVQYVIDRLCNSTGIKGTSASCVSSPAVTAATGNAEEGGEIQLNAPSVVYYRITVRVAGPRNTVGYVQAMVSL